MTERAISPSSISLGGELLGIEVLEEHARRLAGLYTVGKQDRRSSRHYLRRLDDNARVLSAVYAVMRDDVRRGEVVPPAAEWLLDNFHVIAATVRGIHHDLPRAYYRRLPKLVADDLNGVPRVYAMALELIRCSAGRLDAERLRRFVSAFQSSAALTIGELWAWPT